MPRADPNRSPYCATRHLLRNLDDAAELRRNPLVRACFAPASGVRGSAEHGSGLARVHGLVHVSLARCRDRSGLRARTRTGRMHAALLRCDIDRQPLAVVAAELGLSDRQVRRERRAAHEAFLDAFRHSAVEPAPVTVCDVAALRIAQTEELHELGQSALALAGCEEIAGCASLAERRIEALCLASEIDLDAGRYAGAKARLTDAETILARRAHETDERFLLLATERIDLAAWSLRRATGAGDALCAAPPLALAHPDPDAERDVTRRAFLVRALAAYTAQRWEVGDARRGAEAVRRAQILLPTIDRVRIKDRLAVMYADARIRGLGRVFDDYAQLLAIEELAAAHGHVRTLLVVHADRVSSELVTATGGERVLERFLGSLDTGDRRTMPKAVAFAACAAAECERNVAAAHAAVDLVERLQPPRSVLALLARSTRIAVVIREGRYDAARLMAHALWNDAESAGNERIRGGAERHLAAIAVAQRRPVDARRHVAAALVLLERYGTPMGLAATRRAARRLAVGCTP
jgi:hypothetical protein